MDEDEEGELGDADDGAQGSRKVAVETQMRADLASFLDESEAAEEAKRKARPGEFNRADRIDRTHHLTCISQL